MSDFTARYLADYQPTNFIIKTIDLTVELHETETKVTSVLTVERQGKHSKPLVLDGEHLTLLSLSLNNQLLAAPQYQLSETELTLPTNESNFTLTVVTQINPTANTALEGLFKSGGAFCTQCEAEGFRRITYYLDRPDAMAVFTTKVIADKSAYPFLLSNGNSIDKGELPENKHFVTWHDPFPKPCYLFALVAGDFDLLKDNYTTSLGKEVSLEIFVDKGNLSKAHHAMASLKHSMKWDEDTFGLAYDLDIYMIVAVDFFNMGAMENKGLNVFNSKYVLADEASATDTDYFNIEAVIAHEYFHNWTGNRVTCRDWFQLSLKEGLTVFRDQQFSADRHSAAVTRIQNVRVLRSQQFAEDAGPMAHPIRPEKVMEMNNFYTLTVYEKGAEVIRMLHTLLGKAGFRQGMDCYFSRFDGMAVTCDDFIDAMADATNKDLSQFKRWYSQVGTPVLAVTEHFEQMSQMYQLTIEQRQKTSVNAAPLALHIPVAIELIDTETGKTIPHLLEVTDLKQTFNFSNKAKPVVALLANFSAPVKVDFQQDMDELIHIIQFAQDDFCRWDALQKLLSIYITNLVNDVNSEVPQTLFDVLSEQLTQRNDPAYTALLLSLPSFDEMVGKIEEVDPQALYLAIKTLKRLIAQQLQTPLLATYLECLNNQITDESMRIANRSLQHICLYYLSENVDNHSLIEKQFNQANNMTEYLSAVTNLTSTSPALADKLLILFEQKWSKTTLVMDKWFTLSASIVSDDIFQRLSKLSEHKLFSLQNPNRARSLISGFINTNPKAFHCKLGRGYKFLADYVIKLNDINPQVASRMITPLIQFKEFDINCQTLMKTELKRISEHKNLSKDLIEKLTAALS